MTTPVEMPEYTCSNNITEQQVLLSVIAKFMNTTNSEINSQYKNLSAIK